MTVHSPAIPRAATLRAKLDVLHDEYVEAVNYAVAEDDSGRIADLVAAYDEDALRLVAEHEGKTDLLPLLLPMR